jgi:hypothetical protein
MRTFHRTLAVSLAATATAALLAGCGGSDGGGPQTGFLTLGVTDAPVDFADEVVVQFTGVELKPRQGAPFSIDFAPKSLDLLDLQGTTRAVILDGEEVPAGDYEWLRLKVKADPNVGGDSYLRLEVGGEECELRVPSGDETGLKLVRGFKVGVGTITDFTVDFDLRKSIVAPPGQTTMVNTCGNQAYLLKPALRIVDNLQVGTISGAVDANLVTAQCPSPNEAPYPGNVYLFGPMSEASGITPAMAPDDYDGVPDDPNGPDPIASAMVDPNTFRYTIGFVPPGDYEVAYTCDMDDATLDADVVPVAPATGETVVFTPADGVAVTVTANQTVQVDFPAPAP